MRLYLAAILLAVGSLGSMTSLRPAQANPAESAIRSSSRAASSRDLPSRSSTKRLGEKRYVAAGDRAYVIGTENGAFPPMGWHITGQMGGVWAHPIKLLDGYWFKLGSRWLTHAKRFTARPGYVQMSYRPTREVHVTRTEFSPDGIPAVLVGLRLSNAATTEKKVSLDMAVRSELMAAYPWESSEPENAFLFNGRDHGRYDTRDGRLVFREPDKPWYAMVEANRTPVEGGMGENIWGPVSADDQSAFSQYGNGTGGRLRWSVDLPAGGDTTIWIAVAGSHTSKSEATSALLQALSHPEKLLREKISGRMKLLRRSRVSLPDKRLAAAFDWAKMNMADLRRTVTDMRVRKTADGTRYPKAVKTLKKVSGIGAGFPDYPWFFGTDGAYTTYALIASGQWKTAMNHLRTIRDVSEAVNGKTGKVVHEVVTDGSVYFGTNRDAGDTNETAQFAVAVDLLWRWSADRRFLDEMYPFVREGMHYITSGHLDPDHDGWPEGLGMVERSGMGSATLDVASYTWQALRALEEMAAARDDTQTATWAQSRAADMEKRFRSDWWMPKKALYADSLCSTQDASGSVRECDHKGEKLQQRYWIDATPMEVGLAPTPAARRSLSRLQSPTFTGRYGLYHTGKGGGADGQGELAVWTLPNSVMATAESNYGRVDNALFYMDAIARLLGLEMPGALPEIAPSPAYDPFQPLTTRAMFMQAWSAYGVQWPVVRDFLGINPNAPAKTVSVIPDIPTTWPGLSVKNMRVGKDKMAVSTKRSGSAYVTAVQGPPGWSLTIGQVLPPSSKVTSVTLGGKPASYKLETTRRGLEVRVETDTSRTRKLVVRTTS